MDLWPSCVELCKEISSVVGIVHFSATIEHGPGGDSFFALLSRATDNKQSAAAQSSGRDVEKGVDDRRHVGRRVLDVLVAVLAELDVAVLVVEGLVLGQDQFLRLPRRRQRRNRFASLSWQQRFTGSFLLVPIGSYWIFLSPIGSYGFLWAPMGFYGFLWVPMGSYWFLLIPVGYRFSICSFDWRRV